MASTIPSNPPYYQWRCTLQPMAMFQSLSIRLVRYSMESHSLYKKVNSVEMNTSRASLENMLRGFSLQISKWYREFSRQIVLQQGEAKFAAKHLEELLNSGCDAIAITLTRDKLQKYAATSEEIS